MTRGTPKWAIRHQPNGTADVRIGGTWRRNISRAEARAEVSRIMSEGGHQDRHGSSR